MQRSPIRTGMNAPRARDAVPGHVTTAARTTAAERFERARLAAAEDPALGQLWNNLFDDANP